MFFYSPLFLCIFGGLVLRITAAFFSLGYDHPNEVYRLLEPLAFLNGYSTRLPFEWTEQHLSFLPIHFQHFILKGASLFGFHSGARQALVLRILYAILGILPAVAAWRILEFSHASRKTLLFGVALLCFWPEFIYRSVRLMDYSLEAAGLAIALSLVLKPIPIRMVAAGAILGSLFFIRIQTGLHYLSFLLGVLFLNPSRSFSQRLRTALFFTFGYGITVFGLAALEAPSFEELLRPFRNQFSYNFFENKAALDFGSDPWHRYLSEATKFYGFTLFVGGLILLGWSLLKKPTPARWRITLVWLFPFVIHSCISHKEGRFLYGSLWVLIPATLYGLKIKSLSRLQKTLILVGVSLGLLMNLHRVSKHFFIHTEDVKTFSRLSEIWVKKAVSQNQLLEIRTDPDFTPGQFYLRFPGRICYTHPGKLACPPGPRDFILDIQEGKWRLSE